MQIFSAVGKKTFGKKGRFVVEAAGEEYYLVNMEVYIWTALLLSLIHISEPTRLLCMGY